MLRYLNNIHERIKLTYELENDGMLNFLYVAVINVINKLRIKWFRKDICPSTMLNYKSNYPFKYKNNDIKIFISTVIRVSDSMYEYIEEVKTKCFKTANENWYHIPLIKEM